MTQRSDGFDKAATISDVEDRVQTRYPDAEPDVVHHEAVAAVEKFADAPIKDFVDIIAEREARAAVEQDLSAD